MDHKTENGTQSKSLWLDALRESLPSFAISLLIVFMIQSSLFQAFKIPSGSMIPTLRIGDHIFVNKMKYGLKVPFTDFLFDRPIYLMRRDPPQRGDIIVFKFPNDDLHYIKRVVGVPGDRIEVRAKVLYVNQQPAQLEPAEESKTSAVLRELNDPHYPEGNLKLLTEHLPGESPERDAKGHDVMLDNRVDRSRDFGPVTVPEGHLFAMGDNRDWSGDSRVRGFVPIDNVRGKAKVVWLSIWIDLFKGEFKFSPSRTGIVLP